MKVNEIVKEAVLKAYDGKRATIDDPQSGKTIELDLTKPENAASLKPNDQGQLEYDPTPDMGTPGAQPGTAAAGPKPGTEVAIKTDEDGVELEGSEANNKNTYFLDMSSGKPMAKTGVGLTAIVPSKLWTAITPEIEAKADAQGFSKVFISVNGKAIPGLEGGDMKLGSKIIVAPSDFEVISAGPTVNMRRSMGVQSAEKTGIGAPPMRESRDSRPASVHTAPTKKLSESDELMKMLTIAGLK